MRRAEAAVAAVLGLSLLVFLYAAVRAVQAVLFPEPNPALVVWSTRIALFWRVGLVTYGALVVSPLLLRWARRDLAGASRAAAWAVPVAGVAIGLQALVFP